MELDSNKPLRSFVTSVTPTYRTFDISFIKHRMIQAICVWNGFIVTGSCSRNQTGDYFCKMWTDDGTLVSQGKKFRKGIFAVSFLLGWDDLLLICFDGKLKCMKLVQSSMKLKEHREFNATGIPVQTAVIYQNKLFISNGDSNISIYDKNGRIEATFSGTGYHVTKMIVFNDHLWTVGSKIKSWDKTLTNVHSIELGSIYVAAGACNWGNSRIAVYFNTPNVQVFTLEGKLLFSWKTERPVVSLTQWGNRLVAGAHMGTASYLSLVIWNWDGNLYQQFNSLGSSRVLLEHKGRLWQGGDDLRMWEDLRVKEWQLHKLLWIGWKKNLRRDCWLACLPKEIVLYIITLVNT